MSEFRQTVLGTLTINKVLAAIRSHPERTTANALILEHQWSATSAARSVVLGAIAELQEQGLIGMEGALTANALIWPINK